MAAAARFEDFALTVSREGDATLVALRGELDLAAAPQLRSTLLDLHSDGVRTVVLDCAKLTFVDSAGLAAIVHASRRFKSAEGALTVRRPTLAVRRVIEITGVDREVTVEYG